MRKLKFKTKYFVIFLGCPYNDNLPHSTLEVCKRYLKEIEVEKVSVLFGKSDNKNGKPQYVFEIDTPEGREALFEHLNSFETLFHRSWLMSKKEKKACAFRLDFGLDDVGFVGYNRNILCQTVTHEGITFLSDQIKFE